MLMELFHAGIAPQPRGPNQSNATIEALVKALAKAYNMQVQTIQAALSPAETCV